MFAYGRMCVRMLLGVFLFFCRFVRSHGKVRTHMLAFSQSRSLHPFNKKKQLPYVLHPLLHRGIEQKAEWPVSTLVFIWICT